MITQSGLLKTIVYHKRFVPNVHSFRHTVFYVILHDKDFSKPPHTKLLSLNRFNLFSVFLNDYGFNKINSVREYINSTLEKFSIDSSIISHITLVTLPKIFGYAFNPVSFWLCFDEKDQLRICLVEVNNTFGERHGYLCYQSDVSPILAHDVLHHKKVFHVSPFCQVTGDYQFKFDVDSKKIYITIDYLKNSETIITTSIHGKRIALNDKNLLKCFFSYPFMLFKVIFLIHYHAIRLWIKNVPFFKKPTKPTTDIS
jgi:DUF1365 family protein